MLIDFLKSNYISILLMLGLCFLIAHDRKNDKRAYVNLLFTLVITCVLILVTCLEEITALDSSQIVARTVLSAVGYILRPGPALGMLYYICGSWKIRRFLWIPAMANALVFCFSFSPLLFYYDAQYNFHRGPLGYFVFIVSAVYLFLLILQIIRRFRGNRHRDGLLLCFLCVAIFFAAVLEAFGGGNLLAPAILTGIIFYYLFSMLAMEEHDALTGIYNRHAFYEDSEKHNHRITAAAAMDMNGLKELNDTQGHLAGDRALQTIGDCLHKLATDKISVYRVGGDEFVMIFFGGDDQTVAATIAAAESSVDAAGYHIACGYAMRESGESFDSMLRRADAEMYKAKTTWYTLGGNDRRKDRRNSQ